MKNKLHYTRKTRRDLDDIWDYITADLSNPSAAARTVDKIIDAIDHLEDFGEIGVPLNSVARIESDYRFLVCGSYLAFYRINGNDIYIDRILYGRRDYLHILFPDAQENAAE